MKETEYGFIFIIGNMFGSKTSEMIHLLSLEEIMKRKVQAFKISWEDRYGEDEISTHQGTKFPALKVRNTSDLIISLRKDTEVIGIDELQFFDEKIKDFILENKERYLIIGNALQLDFRGNPFPFRSLKGKEYDSEKHVGHLMPYAKIITRYPQCMYQTLTDPSGICRSEAIYIQRFKEDGSLAPYNDPTIVIGGRDRYAPRCIEHFVKPK